MKITEKYRYYFVCLRLSCFLIEKSESLREIYILLTKVSNDDHDYVVNIFLLNVDHDHVQTFDNIYDGMANGDSWSIITPYLESDG